MPGALPVPQPSRVATHLPPEILVEIFKLTSQYSGTSEESLFEIADTYNLRYELPDGTWKKRPYNPLDNARACSQVSSYWRQVAIAAAALWAPLFNTAFFPHPKKTKSRGWWDAVRTRARGTPHWLISSSYWHNGGALPADREVITEYVLPLLDAQRGKLERLVLSLRLDADTARDARWGALLHFGPRAREFSVNFLDTSDESGDALYMPGLALSASAHSLAPHPPMRSLESLWLHSEFCITDILSALGTAGLQSLRNLALITGQNDTAFLSDRAFQAVHLPQLERLTLAITLSECLWVLPRITSTPGCALTLAITDLRLCEPYTARDIKSDAFFNAISHHIKNALCPSRATDSAPVTPDPTCLQVIANSYDFRLNALTIAPEIWTQILDVGFTDGTGGESLAKTILIAAFTCGAGHFLAELEFEWLLDAGIQDSEYMLQNINTFLRSLTYTTKLTADRVLLDIIATSNAPALDSQDYELAIFPGLEKIECDVRSEDTIELLHRVLSSRQGVGIPVKCLALGCTTLRLDRLVRQHFGKGMYPELDLEILPRIYPPDVL